VILAPSPPHARDPDAVTYAGVLSTYSRAGMLGDGLRCFDDMQTMACCAWSSPSARCRSSPSCFDDGLLCLELTERALQELAQLLRLDLERIRRHPNNTKGCLAMTSSKLSRVSTTSVSDAASSAPAEKATASASSEIQALQELRHRFMLQGHGSVRVIPDARWRRDLKEATKRYGGTRSRPREECFLDRSDPIRTGPQIPNVVGCQMVRL
jgi:pentatricopeptide repeat protein